MTPIILPIVSLGWPCQGIMQSNLALSARFQMQHWWVVCISIPRFCAFHEVNNNSTASAVLSLLLANYCQFCTHSNIPWSTFCILPFCHLKQPRFHPESHFKVQKHWKCQILRLRHLWPMESESSIICDILKWFIWC